MDERKMVRTALGLFSFLFSSAGALAIKITIPQKNKNGNENFTEYAQWRNGVCFILCLAPKSRNSKTTYVGFLYIQKNSRFHNFVDVALLPFTNLHEDAQ